MGETGVRDCVGRVVAVLREAGRAEDTVRRQQVVLDRFAAFLAGRGLDTASERVCLDFIANQTGVGLGSGWGRCVSRSKTGLSRRFAGRWC